MLPIDPERQKYAAALEQLEAEQKRRDDERVASGAAVRLPLYLVPHGDQDIAGATEEAKTRKLAELRASGDQRAVIFDEPFLIHTGVPRSADFRKRSCEPEAPSSPYIPDRYAKERAEAAAARASRDDDGLMEPPPPVEWHKFITTVRNPRGDDDPG